MSEALKWTLEVWKAEEVYTDRWCVVDADGNEIADAIETKDHADLLAAAPEMYAALQWWMTHGLYHKTPYNERTMDGFHAALAKARGESS